jgi:hypothetical protein
MSDGLVNSFLLPENTSSPDFYRRRDISITLQDLGKWHILEYGLNHPWLI